MLKKTKWVWAGAAILLLVAIAFLWRYFKEGFENVTGKTKSFVVFASLSTITNLDNQNKIGSIEKGAFDAKYAISSVSDYKGTEVWKVGQTPSTDDTKKQYRLNFPSEITISFVDNSNVPAKTVDVFLPKLAAAIPTSELSYVGDDFTSSFIIVEANIANLVDPYFRGSAANQYKGILSSLGTGRASSEYAVTRILDEAGAVFYDKSGPLRNIYVVRFTSDIDLGIVSTALAIPTGTDRSSLSETDTKSLRLIGVAPTDTTTTFTNVKARTMAVEGPLSAILSNETMELMKTFGTGTANNVYTPASVETADGKTLWTKTTAIKRYKIEFTKPVNLRIAAETISRKVSGAKYVGLAFTDTPPAAKISGALSQLRAADYSTVVNTLTSTAPESQFPSTFLESGQGAPPVETPASADAEPPSYVDPRSQGSIPTGTDYIGYVSTMTPLTNRFRVRGKWSVLSKPGMIATFGIAAGKLPDGTYPKVVEILNFKDQKIWPEGSTGAVPYVDTGITELFTIGYDIMIDPKRSLETYIQTYMPSVTLVNPAMPRTSS